MDDPKVYEKITKMPRNDAREILEHISFPWKEEAKVLDIGCGDGTVTTDLLKNQIPKSFMKLVGCDINQKSVQFARERHGSEKVQFMTLDIQGKIPDELKGTFDHVFSSYVFHWVGKQMTAFTNVYDMLTEGGNCLIIFLERASVYDVYEKLSHVPKWTADLKDVHTKFVLPFFNSQDPANEVRSVMERVGFKNVDVKTIPRTYTYDGAEEFKIIMKFLNPIDSLKAKWDDFMDDCVSMGFDVETVKYRLIVAYGSK